MFILLLAVSLILRIVYILLPTITWWDAAIYTGMGKLIFSGGTIGLWEPFRPVIWPIILGAFWKIGLNPTIVGIILELFFSLALIALVYKQGEKIAPHVGLFASTYLSFTPIFFAFSSVPITDIPSTFLTFFAVSLLFNKKYVVSGLIAGLAFLFRFPQALILIPMIGAVLIIDRDSFKSALKNSIKIIVGFLVLAVPYLISNIILYHDAFLPIRMGNAVFSATSEGTPHYYYLLGTFVQNPFLIFSLIPIVYWLKHWRETSRNIFALVTTSTFILICFYFSIQNHKEMRYAISYLPYLALIAGLGTTMLANKLKIFYPKTIVIIFAILLSIGGILFSQPYWNYHKLSPEYKEFHEFFKDKSGATIISTSPQFIVFGDILIAEISDNWEDLRSSLYRHTNTVDYVAIDTCELHCNTPQCAENKKIAEITLLHLEKLFDKKSGYCALTIYRGR